MAQLSSPSLATYLTLVIAMFSGITPPGCYVHASDIIVTNHPSCTEIGKNLLKKHANVEQIYVAVSICEGIVHPMDSGLGGGFQAVLYDYLNNTKIARYLMSREYSPYDEEFLNYPFIFGNSIGVPSVLAGYARLLGVTRCAVRSSTSSGKSSRYRKNHACVERLKNGTQVGFFDQFSGNNHPRGSAVPYAEIFKDCIELARYGFPASPTFFSSYSGLPGVGIMIHYNHLTGKAVNPLLAKFIEFLSKDPLRLLDPYVEWENRNISKQHNIRRIMLKDTRFFNSKLTKKDFLSYQAEARAVLSVPFHYDGVSYDLITMPSPAGGESIAFFAKMIEKVMAMSGAHRIERRLNDKKIAMLFVLCSKFAYAIKPYFRQLRQITKRKLIINEAPRIAEKLYIEVLNASNDAQLVALYRQQKYRIPRKFGRIWLSHIRISSKKHRAAWRSSTADTMSNQTESVIYDGVDEDESIDDDTASPLAPITTTVRPPLYSDEEEQRHLDFIAAMQPMNISLQYEGIDDEENNDDDSFMGGTDDNPFGTTNVIIKKGKRTIVATSSINHGYGSGIVSMELGIFYNNILRDFSPPTWYQHQSFRNGTKRNIPFNNRAQPHTVPQSSMGCMLLVKRNTKNPVFGIGGAGGFKITGAIFNVLWNYFVQQLSLNNAVNRLRIITKLNYKRNVTELWYELPSHIENPSDILKKSRNFDKKTLGFSRKQRPHAFDFFYNNSRQLNVQFIKEAGYSAVTAYTTLRHVKAAAYDTRRGGQSYIHL